MKVQLQIVVVLIISAFAICANGDEKENSVWATITGQIVVTGKIPKSKWIDVSGFNCGGVTKVRDDSLVIDKNGGLKNVVFMLKKTKSFDQKVPIHPSMKESGNSVSIKELGCTFHPRISFVRTSQKLSVINQDPIGHTFFLFSRKSPNHFLIPAKKPKTIQLENAESVPCKTSCAAHQWMKAFIVVRDEPYVAITSDEGKFRIENMPAGNWKFQFWHEKAGYFTSLTREKTELIQDRVLNVKIEPNRKLELGKMQIDIRDLNK